jgi:hypothetical protein
MGSQFSLNTISFVVQKLFNFICSHLLILSLSCWATCILLRKFLPMPIASSVISVLSYTSFKVSDLLIRFFVHFELILVQVTNMDLISVFCRQIISFPSNICWRSCLFSIISFGTLIKNQVCFDVCVLIQVYFVLLVFMSIFVSVPCHFCCYGSVI